MSASKTPLTILKASSRSGGALCAKLESQNPSGSLKDRMVQFIIDKAIARGELRAGDTIVEASSGNTGIALAQYCVPLGFNVIIFMGAHISENKQERIRSLGATVITDNVSVHTEADIRAAITYSEMHSCYHFNQFGDREHLESYRDTLAAEILTELADQDIAIDILLGGVGTGASLRAVGESLRERHNPGLKIYPLFPECYPTRIEGLHPVQIRGAFKIWADRGSDFEDGEFFISDEFAIEGAKRLHALEEISVGPCSGAQYRMATDLLELPGNVLMLFSDSGDRYQHLQ